MKLEMKLTNPETFLIEMRQDYFIEPEKCIGGKISEEQLTVEGI